MPTENPELTGRVRARIPMAALPALVAARARLDWSRAGTREEARAQMRFLLERATPGVDIEAAARAYLRYQARRGELRWHPSALDRLRVEGLDHLRDARTEGHGVVLNFMHHGYYDGAFPSIARLGMTAHLVVYPYMLQPDAPGWLKQHVKVASAHGGIPTSTDVGTAGLLERLNGGNIVALASDVPGRTPVRFLGRDLIGSFGAARLAQTARSPVVVLTSEEDDDGPVIRLHQPLDPGRSGNAQELFERMLAIHEPVFLRWPEAADLPLSRWKQAGVDDPPAPVLT